MKKLILLTTMTCNIFATAPTHVWEGQLKRCAQKALNQKSDYTLTKEALETIKTFDCSYSGSLNIEPLQDIANVEVLRLHRNQIESNVVTHTDSNSTAYWFDENTTVYTQRWLDKLSNVFFDSNITYSYEYNSTQEIPSWIGNFSSLKELDLSGNMLDGKIPNTITSLPIEILDLSGNHLTALPKSIGNMTALRELDVSHNELVQPFPKEISQLINLEKLYLQNNKLHEVVPDLSTLTKLKRLRLNNNNLRMKITYEMVDVNITSNYFVVDNNCRIELPTDDINKTNETLAWINDKSPSSFDDIEASCGNCFSPALAPIIFYLLRDINETNGSI